MADLPPTPAVHRAHLLLFEQLLAQMLDKGLFEVEDCQRVFDGAEKKASSEPNPEVKRAVQIIHDDLPWDAMFRLAAARRAEKS